MAKCSKDYAIVISCVVAVMIFVAGIVITQSGKASGDVQIIKQDLQRQQDELKHDTNDKLAEIKSDVKDMRNEISEIKTILINQKG
ncbi:MAG: hypothetical protein HZA82_05955 [Thaumarchaeota archaeon]|nr:hypothetical protein [Nitrososphaerota archaeon]